MTSQLVAAPVRPRGLLATAGYARLWFAGGVGNATRWLELLVAGIFTYEATHSALLVALVTAARSLPMLLLGPIAGVIAEAINRKRLLLAQLAVMAATSAALAGLAFAGEVRVWHILLGGAVGGVAAASELAVRRRMIGEVVPTDRVSAAVALDSLTNSFARVLGPIAGGAVFELLGLGGAYLVSAALYVAAFLAVLGLGFHQEPRRLRFGRIPGEIAEGLAVARANPAILAVVLVSIVMNSFGFCYSALIAPIGIDVYRVSPILVGALLSAEPIGAIAAGIALAAGWLRLDGSRALLRGSFLFLGGVVAMALSPWYGLAFVLLVIGGLGTAAFSNMQTTLILVEAPPAARSRVMGIVTMCIGTGPIGVLMIGALSEQLGPAAAILVTATIGLAGLALIWRRLIRGPPPLTPTPALPR
ncbi:MAG TPA: MFS transporter [Stellaceae bacterium]|nr:MFS transporter [Stellaceae bacterium]